MALFGNRVFADVIKIKSYWITVGPKTNDWHFYKRKERESWIQRYREDTGEKPV